MSIRFVGAASASGSSNLVVARPAGTVPGDILIGMFGGSTGMGVPTDWIFMGGNGNNSRACYKIVQPGEPASYTIDPSSPGHQMIGGIVAYRGNRRRQAEPIIDAGIDYDTLFGFEDTVRFAHANSQGTQQRKGMLFIAANLTDSNGNSNSHPWPPAGMTDRMIAVAAGGSRTLCFADKLMVDPPITSQTPAGLTFTHSGGSFQSWMSCTVLVNMMPNRQGVM